jgi:hypothetical protein
LQRVKGLWRCADRLRQRQPGLTRERGAGQAGGLQDPLLVERFMCQQGLDEPVELLAMRAKEPARLLLTLGDDPAHFGIDDAGGLLAEVLGRARAGEAAPPKHPHIKPDEQQSRAEAK